MCTLLPTTSDSDRDGYVNTVGMACKIGVLVDVMVGAMCTLLPTTSAEYSGYGLQNWCINLRACNVVLYTKFVCR
jgi:hypothetical protein